MIDHFKHQSTIKIPSNNHLSHFSIGPDSAPTQGAYTAVFFVGFTLQCLAVLYDTSQQMRRVAGGLGSSAYGTPGNSQFSYGDG